MLTKSFLISLLLFASPFLGTENQVVLEDSAPVAMANASEVVSEPILTSSPQKKTDSLGMKITAESALVTDLNSGLVLYAKNPDKKVAMASITKVMTVLLALDEKDRFEEEVLIDNEMILLEGAKIKLLRDEKIRLGDLVKGALISSGNDAACAVGKYLGDGDLSRFTELMNKKASELGLENTQFKNPTGLDEEGHYSTARDLTKLFTEALKDESFRDMINTKDTEAHALNVEKIHYFHNTNRLLHGSYPYMKGGKTGYTENAGFCLLSLSGNSDKDEIITVVLGSDLNGNQFQDSKALIEWSYNNFEWK
ncbi:D-alanyl-D-alanine carboxypeptidase [Patescibacteria group bacterium]|nr:D-alanyl-D-alanine carboxypeptidase [Patescibacteria group bacterium]